MLSPNPNLDRVVKQDYLTNLYHFAWILNALNDKHLSPAKFGIKEPLDWLCDHPGQTANTILAIDDHFQLKRLKVAKDDTLSRLYEDKVAHNRRKLLSNLDVR